VRGARATSEARPKSVQRRARLWPLFASAAFVLVAVDGVPTAAVSSAPSPCSSASCGPTWWKLAAFGEFREHALSVSLAPRPEPRQHVTSLSPAAMANAPWIGAL
jgi:hypothetical protein